MAENQIPIEIVIDPSSKLEAGVVRALKDIENTVNSQGRQIGKKLGESTARGISSAKSQIDRAWKQNASAKEAIQRTQLQRDKVFAKREIDIEKQKNAQIEAMWKQREQSIIASKKRLETINIQQGQPGHGPQIVKDTLAARNDPTAAIYKTAGVKSPTQVANQIKAITTAQTQLNKELRTGNITQKQASIVSRELNKRMNLLTKGVSNARSNFRRLTARIASFSFELTGAIYGLGATAAAFGAPAIAGAKFLSTIEDTQLGMSGILMSMGKVEGKSVTFAQAMGAAKSMTDELRKSSIRYGVALQDLTTTLQATLAPGLAAGMTLSEIQKVATIGAVAVKAIGLDSRQVVQEIRDLVAGGIQAASSTLATSLGLKDSDIKRAKNSAEGLYTFLMKRLSAFETAALKRRDTLSGSFELLKQKITLLFADEATFDGIKKAIKNVSEVIGEFKDDGTIIFTPEVKKATQDYLWLLKQLVQVLGTLIKYTVQYSNIITSVIRGFVVWKTLKIGAGLFNKLLFGKLGDSSSAIGAAKKAFSVANGGAKGLLMAGRTLLGGISGGWIGLILMGTYAAADYFGLIDKIFDTAAKKAERFKQQTLQLDDANLLEDIKLYGQALALAQSKLSKLHTQEDVNRVIKLRNSLKTLTDEYAKRNKLAEKPVVIMGPTSEKDYKTLIELAEKLNIEEAVREKNLEGLQQATKQYDSAMKGLKQQLADSNLAPEKAMELNKQILLLKAVFPEIIKSFQTKPRGQDFIDSMISKTKELKEKLNELNGAIPSSTKNVDKYYEEIKKTGKKTTIDPSQRATALAAAEAADAAASTLKIKQRQIRIDKVANDIIKDTIDIQQNAQRAVEQRELAQRNLSGYALESAQLELDLKNELADLDTEYAKLIADNAKDDIASQERIISLWDKKKQAVISANQVLQDAASKAEEDQKKWQTGADAAWKKYEDSIGTVAENSEKLFTKAFQGMEDALTEFATTGKITFSGLIDSMTADLARMVSHSLTNDLGKMVMGDSGSFSEGFGNIFGDLGSGIGDFFGGLFNENGNAFSNRGLVPFAAGGAFTNNIVAHPTLFPFAKGIGLMGEAGPEAIMPLTRTSSGELGVKTDGRSNRGQAPIIINNNITTKDRDSFVYSESQIGSVTANRVSRAQRRNK